MAPLAPSRRSRAIEESATLAISARAAALRAAGQDVISLGAGEPDFPTPGPVAAAGIEAIRSGDTRYTAAAGTPELRAAGARWFRNTFGLDYSPAEVMATAGAKPALMMALMSLVEPGDRALVLAPYWVSYPALLHVAGGEPVVVPAAPEQGFVHDAATLETIARETDARGLLLNFPNNPSGACPTREQLQAIVDLCAAQEMWILSDEIYGTLLYDGAEHVSPAGLPGGRERTIVVNGGTKSHSLTGWRIGFLAGPSELVAAAAKIQSQVIGNPSTISQAAGKAACEVPLQEEMNERIAAFDERRRYLVEEIGRIPGLALSPPKGAFYALVDARDWCRRCDTDDNGLTERLLEEQLVAVVPGSAFAIPGFLRLSYAVSLDELREAVRRLRAFGESLG